MSETNTKRIVVNRVLPSLPLSVEHTPENLCNKHLPFTGRGVKICLIDSGTPDHEAIITLSDDINFTKSPNTRDHTGHATALAGLLVGNKPDQITGIAPNATLLNAKAVDDDCIVRLDALIASTLWAIIQKSDIIVIPIVTDINSPSFEAAIQKAIGAGILVVAAAGNKNHIEYPAKYQGVISVGAKSQAGTIVTAKGTLNVNGTNLETTYLDQSYCVVSGSSVATAVAAGLLARAFEENKTTALNRVKSICE